MNSSPTITRSTSFALTVSTNSLTQDSQDVRKLCLLSLDGGGVRGLSSLQILKQLMETVNPNDPPKPCDYFDMIGGTSTGGLIAIMLGRLRMSVDACMTAYVNMSDKIFQKKRHRFKLTGQIQGRFDSDELEKAVKQVLKDQGMDPEELMRDDPEAACKVFVCATSAETSDIVHLASYRSPRGRQHLYKVCKIWEAVRATSAASSFFEPICIGDYREEFIDGATGANNPVGELVNEARDVWPEGNIDEQIQCLVSIGTGVPGLKEFGIRLKDIAKALKSISTETEKTAERFARDKGRLEEEGRYFRFNVLKGLEEIGLQESARRNEIVAATGRYVESQAVFRQMRVCAMRLRAGHDARLIPLASAAEEPPDQNGMRDSAMEVLPSGPLQSRSQTYPQSQSLRQPLARSETCPQQVSQTDAEARPEAHRTPDGSSPQAPPTGLFNEWNGGSTLHEAIELGDLNELSRLLSKADIDPNAEDDGGNTPLLLAARKGDATAVRMLLRKGADPGVENDKGQNALHLAADKGHKVVVGLLLNRGADIESRDVKGRRAVHYAAINGHEDVLQLLKDKNARLDIQDYEGNTPLHHSASMGKAAAAQYLVQNQVDARVKNVAGVTAVQLAQIQGFENVAVTLTFEADRKTIEASGRTKLHWAAQNDQHTLIESILGEPGANVNARDRDKYTPLHLAARFGNVEAAKILLDKGADIEAEFQGALTPLLLAIVNEMIPLVELLLKRGANIDAKEDGGRTVLYLAATKGNDRMIDLLISHGAKKDRSAVYVAVRGGFTAVTLRLLDTEKEPGARAALANDLLMDAVKSRNEELCLALIKEGREDPQALEKYPKVLWLTATSQSKAEVVRALIEAGADPCMKAESRLEPLSLLQACMESGPARRASVGVLLEKGAMKGEHAKTFLSWTALHARDMIDLVIDSKAVDIDAVDEKEQSALFYVVMQRKEKLVQLLLSRGASPESSPKAHSTPLQKAAEFGNIGIVKLLLDAGAGVDTPNSEGETALMNAARNNKDKVVEMLLEHGANPNATQRARRSALHCAASVRSEPIIEMLQRAGADMNAKDEYGRTALEFAALERELATVRALVQAGADVSASPMALHFAIGRHGSDGKEMAIFLLRNGAGVQAVTADEGETPLFKAAFEDQMEVAQMLLEHGVDPNARNKRGETAIFNAIVYEHEGFVKLLLKHGASVTPFYAANEQARNPLAEALRTHHPTRKTIAIVKMLLDAGADPNSKDRHGAPVLYLAVAESSSEELVKMLIERGADVRAKDSNGDGALNWAKRAQYRSRKAMDELMRSYGLVSE